MEKERARRALNEEYEQNPLGTVVKVLAGHGVLPGSHDAEASSDEGSIPADALRSMTQALQDVSDEDFTRCCQYLLDHKIPEEILTKSQLGFFCQHLLGGIPENRRY